MNKILAFALTLTLLTSTQESVAGIIENLPDAVVCSVKDPTGFLSWEELVFFVSAHTRDGDTLYKTLTSDPVVLIIDASGEIKASNLADCDGRKIDELVESGRAFHLTNPPSDN